MDTLIPLRSAREARSYTRGFVDGLGRGLDTKIAPTIAGMWRFGVETSASCQGHIRRGLPHPWITVPRRAASDLERLLAAYPLEGFAPFDFGFAEGTSHFRLQPIVANTLDGFSIMTPSALKNIRRRYREGIPERILERAATGRPPLSREDIRGDHIVIDTALRARLTGLLPQHQNTVMQWGRALLIA